MYSKGPWEVKPEEVDKPYIRIRGTRLGGRFKIANVLLPVYENFPQRELDEVRHNARLITSSPEMFELLVSINGDYHLSVEHQKQLNDLILKVGLK
ncbi:hypothetical protein [Proteus phage vB_PmiP_RS10pmA]|nr:hypothetical protein [Proteus phage vB_PmiP_RS10pmA]